MQISVIIPTINEERCLERTLRQVLRDGPVEILVADGGSCDGTKAIAARWATVLETPRGRAIQQNHAARTACGDILLFLHADCWPEHGWQKAIRHAMRRSDCVAGCFRMQIDGAGLAYRAIERGGDLRVRWLSLPYGDQGIFMRRDLFLKFGGFPAVGLMEDLLFMRHIRAFGRIELVRHTIHVSSRRWEHAGIVRQTVRNWILATLAVSFGVHPDSLLRHYPAVR